MGGAVPLGYDVKDRQLLVNEPEAEQVRQLFKLYQQHNAVDLVVKKAAALGIRSKIRSTAKGNSGGTTLGRGSLYRLLANAIYVGDIPHKGVRHTGQHTGIVDKGLYEAVQALLEGNRRKQKGALTAAVPAPLAGLVWADNGERLISTHTSGAKRYRYYASTKIRVPAVELENVIITAISEHLSSPVKLALLLPHLKLLTTDIQDKAAALTKQITANTTPHARRQQMLDLVDRVVLGAEGITINVKLAAIGGEGIAELCVPATLGRTKARLSLVVPGQEKPKPDQALIGIIAQARAWVEQLTSGKCETLASVAAAEGLTSAYVRRFVGAGVLAPDLVQKIVEGRHPPALTVARLADILPLPHEWAEQRALVAALS